MNLHKPFKTIRHNNQPSNIKFFLTSDYFFIFVLFCGLLFHLSLIWYPNFIDDETFFATIPFKLVNGDSLIQDEWHLTQFSSLFLYLPVRIWLLIKGSADGIYLYLRFLFIFIYTAITALVYKFFRNYGIWSAVAAIMFYMMVPYGMYALSYTSMFAIFLLLFTLCLISIYKYKSKKYCIFAGLCFGSCCVNNPVICLFYLLYLMLCILWIKKDLLINLLSGFYMVRNTEQNNRKKAKTKSFETKKINVLQKKEILSHEFENYNYLFSKKAIVYSTFGISIIAVISIVFFFFTGGTISSIFENISNLMQASEYSATLGSSFIQKKQDFITAINIMSFDMPYLFPLFFLVLIVDKKRKTNSHRIIYLTLSILLFVLFIAGMYSTLYKMNNYHIAYFFTLPLALFSIVSYILTNKRQTTLFFCVWIPCSAISLVYLYVSNTLLYSTSVIFTISNIAGVFFVYNLFNEICFEACDQKARNPLNVKWLSYSIHIITIVVICFQLFVSCFCTRYYNIQYKSQADSFKATSGPLEGLYFNEEQYDSYIKRLDDLDYIKSISNKNDPVFFVSYRNWMYLYTERPIATHTTCLEVFDFDSLSAYYKENPEKIPKFIYIVPSENVRFTLITDNYEQFIDYIDDHFDYTSEQLSYGILLTVTHYNYEIN